MTWHPDIPESYRNKIVTGDARELAKHIPDESIDLIFTDPVYDRIEDYEWLAELSMRVLTSTGSLLCWSNGKWHYQNTKWLENAGMNYRWTFNHINQDTSAFLNGKIIAKSNRVIWMDLNAKAKMIDYCPDGYATYGSRTTIPRVFFKWYKSAPYTLMLLRAFAPASAVILDVFCGSGTIPSCSRQRRLNYIAFEIDPDAAELARWRVSNTQPPLFVLEPEQLSFEEELCELPAQQ